MKGIVHRRDGTPIADGEGGRSRAGTVDMVASILKTATRLRVEGREIAEISWLPLVPPSRDELLRIGLTCCASVMEYLAPLKMIRATFHVKYGGTSHRNSEGYVDGGVIPGGAPDTTGPWYMGDKGFGVKNPEALETPVPYRGVLGIFKLTAEGLGL